MVFSNLNLVALNQSSDFSTAIDLAITHGFGGLDPDLDYLGSLDDPACVAEAGRRVADSGLRWGIGSLPVNLTAPAREFTESLAGLHRALDACTAAGVTALGTWIRPMDDNLPYGQNWTRHVGRLALVAELLRDAGVRLGLEYVGPKTFWSTERFPFIHSLAEARDLIADSGASNVGVILDTFHWYTARESAEDLRSLGASDVVSVDINDAPPGRDRDSQQDLDRRLPGTTGVIDLSSFMTALTDIGYDGPVKVEPFMKALADRPIDDVLSEASDLLNRALAM